MDEDCKISTGRARRIQTIVGATIASLIIVSGALILLSVLLFRENVPLLTEADYTAALERWERNGPESYDCEIEISGNRPGIVKVQVRDGRVTHMSRDSVVPEQQRTWDYWTIDGQFDTIGEELEMASNPKHAFGGAAAAASLHARFHPELGYPEVFRRTVPGVHQDLSWRMTRFEAVP